MERVTQAVGSRVVTGASPRATDVAVSLLPGGAYLLAHPVLGAVGAMAVASAISLGVLLGRRRRGRSIGVILPATVAWLALRTAAGTVTGSEAVYFGSGLAVSALVALAVGATAWTATPAAAPLIPLVARYRHVRPDHPLHRRVSAQVTAAWAAAELVVTALEANHLLHTTGSQFVVTRTVVAWPAMAGVIFVLVFYLRARLDPLEHHLAATSQDAPASPHPHPGPPRHPAGAPAGDR